MIIGIDGRSILYKQKTGVEIYVDNLLKNLAKIDKRNRYLIYVHQEPGDLAEKFPSNFSFRVLKFPKLWTQIRLPLDSLFKKPDIFLFPAHSLPLLWRQKSVIVVHDLAFLRLPEIFPFSERARLVSLTKNAIKKAAHIIAISNSTKKDLIEFYHLPASKISVIYHGYDKELFKPRPLESAEKVKQKYKLKEPYFIYLATLHKCNVENLVKAFSILKSKILNLKSKLVLAGKPGWKYKELIELINKTKLVENVVLPGYVLDKDLPLLLQGAKALVFPSLYEGFGLPPLEAMAVGTPCIVSNNSSLPEVVGEAGILIDPKNEEEIAGAMEKIIKTPELGKKLREKGLKQASLFSWEKCARETIASLEKASKK